VPEFEVETLSTAGFVGFAARNGVAPAAIEAGFGHPLPRGSGWKEFDNVLVLGTGPGTWLARAIGPSPSWSEQLESRLQDLASTFDQSSAYACLRLSGAGALDLLQRGVSIDLDGADFVPGSSAATAIAHIPLLLWQRDLAPTYELAVPTTFATSFRRWMERASTASCPLEETRCPSHSS
jgi:methylglutamate dehydrogenase subunit D